MEWATDDSISFVYRGFKTIVNELRLSVGAFKTLAESSFLKNIHIIVI